METIKLKMNKTYLLLVISVIAVMLVGSCVSSNQKEPQINEKSEGVYVAESLLVDSVWAANKVSFALHTVGENQYVAYYDKNRMMTVASRKLGDGTWQKKTLPNKLKWDSHNYVAMGIDEAGYIHVSGNMHVNPLVYFRSMKPYDINSLVEVNRMTDDEESDVTYPKFFYDGSDRLYFSYRSGTCGNGNVLINQFDTKSQNWNRYLTKPLFEGKEKDDDRAAYHKSVKDSKGNFHYIWMWRWTPEVATSHQICYATSPDLLHWKNAAGEDVQLPFRPDDQRLIVDPTPTKGGMHNSRYQLILSPDEKPLIAYLKYDEAGMTQLYLAKHANEKWLNEKISNWNFRWKFVGGGDQMTKGASFSLEGFTDQGELVINWDTETGDSGEYVVDLTMMKAVKKNHNLVPRNPRSLRDKISKDPNLFVAIHNDSGTATRDDEHYILKWEAMKKSHGRHAPEVIPAGPVSPLYVYKIKRDNK